MNWTETRDVLIAAGMPAERLSEMWRPGIDLSGANLSGADLRRADLSGADGSFVTGSFGRHHAVAAGGYISIGCERHSYAEWLKRYEEIGRVHDYSPAEIEVYGQWIRMAVAWLEPIEAALTAKAAG